MMLPRMLRMSPLLLALTALALGAAACSDGAGAAATADASPAGGTTGAGGGSQETGTTRPSTTTPQAEATTGSASGTPATPIPAASSATQTAARKQFPPQDDLNKIVVAYTVANEHPELLTGLPCYCPSDFGRFTRVVGPIFMFPVRDGRIFWERWRLSDVPGLRDGMTVDSFFAVLGTLSGEAEGLQLPRSSGR